MNVGFLIYSLGGGGAERVLAELANELEQQGNRVSIFLYEEQIKYQVNSNISVINCSGVASVTKKSYMMRIAHLRKKVREAQIDVLLPFSLSMLGLARLSTVGTKTKIIGNERANPKCYSTKRKKIIKYIAPYCDGMVFQTEGAKNCYPKKMWEKSIVIPNPAPMVECIAKPLQNKTLKICSVSNLQPPKDIETLLRAYQKFFLSYPDSSLTIYGEGVLEKEIRESITEKGLVGKIRLSGFQYNIISLLKNYDMFVFSSRAEGMPNALIEAMATGLPCIATDCQFGPGELIKNGENGFLVPVGNDAIMAEKMMWLAKNSAQARQMGKKAAEIQTAQSRKIVYEKYIDYLEQITQKKARI